MFIASCVQRAVAVVSPAARGAQASHPTGRSPRAAAHLRGLHAARVLLPLPLVPAGGALSHRTLAARRRAGVARLARRRAGEACG